MRGKGILIGGIAVIAVAGVGAMAVYRHRTQAATPVRRPSAALIANAGGLTFSGAIRPQHIVSVGTELTGNVEAVLADVGQDVYEGQVLARVGASGLESAREAASHAVEQAQEQIVREQGLVASTMLEASRADADAQRSRTELDRVQKLYERQKTLFAAGATPRLTYQKVERDFEAAGADYEAKEKAARAAHEEVTSVNDRLAALKKILEDKTHLLENASTALQAAEIQAPADGVVVGRNATTGQQVGPGSKDLFQIATDMFALEVPLEAPAAVAPQIHPGQPALVLILDLQSAGFSGQVKSVEGNQVVVEFECNLQSIKPGMRADVRLKLD